MISLCMIVKNEEKYLRDCLESVKGIVDELIIVDTGSVDSSKSIAKEYQANLYEYEWINCFSSARNYSLSKATSEWILVLDADERLDPKDKQKIIDIKNSKDYKGYNCKIINIDTQKNTPSLMSFTRIFPNKSNVFFEGKVHEQVINSLLNNGYEVVNSGIDILHLGYNLSKEDIKTKANRNLSLLLEEYKTFPSPYAAFQIGQSYGILDRMKEAANYFRISLSDNGKLNKTYRATSLRYLSAYYYENGDYHKAYELIEKALAEDSLQPLSWLLFAQIQVTNENVSNVKHAIRKAYVINTKCINREISSDQLIYYNQKEMLYHCLNYSLLIKDTFEFNYYYKELEKLSLLDPEIDLINKLINNCKFNPPDIIEYEKVVNANNLELFLSLIENYSDPLFKVTLLTELTNNIIDARLFVKLGLLHLNNENIESAKHYLEKSYFLNDNIPSLFFYLISVYARLGDIPKIIDVLKTAEKKYGDNNIVAPRIKQIKSRLNLP